MKSLRVVVDKTNLESEKIYVKNIKVEMKIKTSHTEWGHLIGPFPSGVQQNKYRKTKKKGSSSLILKTFKNSFNFFVKKGCQLGKTA